MCDKEKADKYVDLLVEALTLFYIHDAGDLWTSRKADERAMVGCIDRHAWCCHKRPEYSSLLPHIDIEYDKMAKFGESGIVRKAFERSIDCLTFFKCKRYKSCGKIIRNKMCKEDHAVGRKYKSCVFREQYYFRPDMIIHKRNTPLDEGNGLVVEFKSKDKRKPGLEFDVARVKFCTCMKQSFRYFVGAVVLLNKDICEVRVFRDGKKVESFFVNSKGRVPLPKKMLCNNKRNKRQNHTNTN